MQSSVNTSCIERMETWFYEVVSIDGDYANLKRTDIELDDLKLVARALLPAEIMVGSKLKYELMQYEMMEQKYADICDKSKR